MPNKNNSPIEVHDQDTTTESEPVAAPEPWFPLTPREVEVATLLCRGFKNAEIGDAMGISGKTVDTHRGHILKKLKVRGNVALLRLAIVRGWFTIDHSADVVLEGEDRW